MMSFFVKGTRVTLISIFIVLMGIASVSAATRIEMTPEAREFFSKISGDKYLHWGTYKGF